MFSALCLILGRVIFGSCSRFFFPKTQLVQMRLKSTILVLVDQKTFSQALLNHVGVHKQTYDRPGRVPYWPGVLVGPSRFQSITAWCITNVTVVPTTCWSLTSPPPPFIFGLILHLFHDHSHPMWQNLVWTSRLDRWSFHISSISE